MLATQGVAIKLISAPEISTVTTFYSPFVREMMCWWLARARKKYVVVDCLVWQFPQQ
jgi:hypothetical protein